MGINKNFVVKNGFEVSTNLILANADTRKVGIGSTVPQRTLDVLGGIGATDLYVSGLSTVANRFNVGTGGTVLTVLGIGGSVGVGTAIPAYLLDIRSPVSTGQTALYVQGDVRVTGDLSVDDITFDNATLNDLTVNNQATLQNLSIPGFSTFSNRAVFSDYVDIEDGLYVSVGISTFAGITTVTGATLFSKQLNVSGVSTFAGITTVTGTTLFSKQLNVSGVSTFGGITTVTGTTLFSKQLNVSGVSTFGGITTVTGTTLFTTQLVSSGVATASALHIGATSVINNSRQLQNIASLDATTTATIESAIANAPNTFTDITVSGLSTFVGLATFNNGLQVVSGVSTFAGITTVTGTTLFSKQLNVSGVSTLGTVQISSGIVTAATGIVTYYGDGRYLQNILSGVGINTAGGNVGFGATILDFRGAGISTVTVASGIATINITSGGGGTPGGSNTQIQYNNSGTFGGVSGFTYNGTDLNFTGILTATNLRSTNGTITNLTGTAGTITTFNSTNGTITNLTGTDINITGVATATDFNSLSDINYKQNVSTVPDALSKVEQLRGVKFDWKESGLPSYGVIAQELEEVLPELVHGYDPKTVNYNGIIGVLIEAVKELSAEIQELKSQLNK